MNIKYFLLFTFVLVSVIVFTIPYTSCNNTSKCKNVVCLNGGDCDNGVCKCLVGYEGPNCELLMRDKFIWHYNGGDSCGIILVDSMVYRHYVNGVYFKAILHKPLELEIMNFLNNPNDSATATMVASDSFILQGANNSLTYTGSGFMSNDTIWMNYVVHHDTDSPYSCKFMGLKY